MNNVVNKKLLIYVLHFGYVNFSIRYVATLVPTRITYFENIYFYSLTFIHTVLTYIHTYIHTNTCSFMGFLVLLKKHLYIYIITLYTDMAKSLLKACTFSCLWSFPRVLFLSFYLSASSIVHFITPALHPVITFSKFCIIGNTNAQGLASVFKSKSSVVLTTRPQCWFYLQLKKILLSL